MVPFLTATRCELWDPVRNLWTAPRCRLSVRRIRSSLCPRPSAGHLSGFVSFSCTICRLKPPTNEAPASANYRQSPSRTLRADFYLRSGAAPSASMSEKDSQPLLAAIVGPTASGKSALGVWLAERFGGEVVACDSTQLYRGFDIGTAKPGQEERRGFPHHLIDVLTPFEEATAGGYRERALTVLEELGRRGRLPIFTVGTGLYLRALLEGLADVPQRSEELRKRLRASSQAHPGGYLHRMLRRLDPEAAGR